MVKSRLQFCLSYWQKVQKLRFNLNKIKRGQEFVFLLILETFRFYDMDDYENDIFSTLNDARA